MSLSGDPAARLRAQAVEAAELCANACRDAPFAAIAGHVLQRAALAAARQHRLLSHGDRLDARLFEHTHRALSSYEPELVDRLIGMLDGEPAWLEVPPETLGQLYEQLIAYVPEARKDGRLALVSTRGRKQSGSFLTPPSLTEPAVESAFAPLLARCNEESEALRRLCVCDPALGAGAFLVAACRQLERALGLGVASRRWLATHSVYGLDTSSMAVAVAELCLWLYVADESWSPRAAGEHLRVCDTPQGALSFDWQGACPEVFAKGGFDAVIGNPPWIAYAGRAAQPLSPAIKDYYRRRFSAYRGYPTLHGLFVELAAELAPRGVVALLLPSPVADLAGYAAVRQALSRTHTVREPLLELGQDAFAGVTQPSFVLVADPGPAPERAGAPWRLSERQRAASAALEVRPPTVLERVARGEPFPRALFGEMGFQTSRQASRCLLLRAAEPDALHRYPLLEGRDVREFQEGPPRLFLRAEPELLREAKVRLRPEDDYLRVRFVVRQTAAVPIAALHGGLPFRNTLLAGFEHPEYPPELAVGLLNSALYRALHLAAQRDARQAVFPQMKIAHLRALPRPPHVPALWARLAELVQRATHHAIEPELRRGLDDTVFELFDVPSEEQREVRAFLVSRGQKVAP